MYRLLTYFLFTLHTSYYFFSRFTRCQRFLKILILSLIKHQVLLYSSKCWVCEWNMKATEEYFPVVLFIILYKVVLTFEPVDEIVKFHRSNQSYWAVLSCSAIYFSISRKPKIVSPLDLGHFSKETILIHVHRRKIDRNSRGDNRF